VRTTALAATAAGAMAVLTLAGCGGGPGYSAQLARTCNGQMIQVNADHDLAMGSIADFPHYQKAALAMVKRMKHEGCPNGPYPLKIPR